MRCFASGLGLLLAACGIALADGPRLGEGVGSPAYNRAGRALNRALSLVAEAFREGPAALDEAPPWAQGSLEVAPWTERPLTPAPPGVRALALVPAPGRLPAGRWWSERRRAFARLDEVALKVLLVDRVEADGRVRARIRFRAVGTTLAGARRTERAVLASEWLVEDETASLIALRPLRGEVVEGDGRAFVERAAEWGLDCVGDPDPRFLPPSQALRYQVIRHAVGGAAASDLDGDGYDDLLLTTGDRLRFYRNEGGRRFREATHEVGLADVRHANAPLFADFDNDGDPDLFLGRFYGQNLLFENVDGRLVDRTRGSGLASDDATAVVAAADFDGDGRLDLYLGRFLDARKEVPDMILYTRNGEPNRLYLGDGALRFRDASAASGADDRGLTLGVGAADADGDGDVDLYLSNDYGRNVFLRNRGDGTFVDVALETGTLAVSGGMSVAWGDFDNDERLDLYVSSIGSNQRWFSQPPNIRSYVVNIVQSGRREGLQELFLDLRKHLGDRWAQVGDLSLAGNYLLRQGADGRFEDWSERAHARPPGWYWSSGFFDVDNDGWQDVFAVAGWITGASKDDL
ncbi:MAG: VCBS repeat-containing protein [Planctomycetota bacterium]|nr:MAG: VCBS repeat-containing protein [Planctomycetota bacterium]